MADSTGTYSRVTGVLIWYDEPLELLAASVSSLVGVVDHLVAVDGAYGLYPGGQPSSDPPQARLISEICSGSRIGLTLHTPAQTWAGNEVQKRNHALKLAEAVTDPNGWYFITDADFVVTYVASDWFEQLALLKEYPWESVNIAIRETRPIPGFHLDPQDGYGTLQHVIRAHRGLEIGPAHWIYSYQGEWEEEHTLVYVRGPQEVKPEPAYDGTHLLKLDHRDGRPEYRNTSRLKYYSRREQFGIESLSRTHTRGLDGEFHEHQGQ